MAEVVVDRDGPCRVDAEVGKAGLGRGRRMVSDAADREQVDVGELAPGGA